MKIAISNSGPLIHLASIGLLDLLFSLYNKIFISESVYQETVVTGKEYEFPDALIIEQSINDKKIEIKKIPMETNTLKFSKLHPGEIDTIRLALNLESDIVFLDDEEARIFARTMNLKVKGTLGILIDLAKKRIINLKKALQCLKDLNSLMYLSSDIYNFVVDELEKIDNKK